MTSGAGHAAIPPDKLVTPESLPPGPRSGLRGPHAPGRRFRLPAGTTAGNPSECRSVGVPTRVGTGGVCGARKPFRKGILLAYRRESEPAGYAVRWCWLARCRASGIPEGWVAWGTESEGLRVAPISGYDLSSLRDEGGTGKRESERSGCPSCPPRADDSAWGTGIRRSVRGSDLRLCSAIPPGWWCVPTRVGPGGVCGARRPFRRSTRLGPTIPPFWWHTNCHFVSDAALLAYRREWEPAGKRGAEGREVPVSLRLRPGRQVVHGEAAWGGRGRREARGIVSSALEWRLHPF